MEKLEAIIFWHRGDNWYLKTAIEQAQKNNKNIVLLGDKSNSEFCENHFNIDDLPKEKFQRFMSVYKNLSFSSEIFELRCFERYFSVLEYCEEFNIKRFVMCDSDVLLYDDIEKYFWGVNLSFSHTVTEPDGFSLNPGCSLWTLDRLEQFIEFLVKYYSQNMNILERIFDEYKKTHKRGGICDMTLLYIWVKNNNLSYFNTAKENEYGVIDHIITSSNNSVLDEYKFSKLLGIKKLVFEDGYPYFFKKRDGKRVRVIGLHCAGGYKTYMQFFVKRKIKLFSLLRARLLLQFEKLRKK